MRVPVTKIAKLRPPPPGNAKPRNRGGQESSDQVVFAPSGENLGGGPPLPGIIREPLVLR